MRRGLTPYRRAIAAAVLPPLLVATGCASADNQASATPASSASTATATTTATTTATATSASPSPTTATPCRTNELEVQLGPGGVAAGTWATLLEFTNTANTPCTMTGWPAVAGVTSSGATSPAANRSDAMDGLNTTGTPHVTLRPGGKAGIDISGADNAAGGGSCPPPYGKLRVSAPGDPTSVTVPATTSALADGLPSCAPLTASPVHPLADFSFNGQ